jgi:5-methylcytosine-specific restriction endonuclease McrA
MRSMENISSLSGPELIKRTLDLVVVERRTTMELIEHLREIERRMLFLETGHSSLFEFAVKHLGLSEGSVQRRISAMRLIRDIPEAKAKIESGEISLSNASQIQSVFRAATATEHSRKNTAPNMGLDKKKEILEKISGMTQRECQSALLELVPGSAPQLMERDRQVGKERFELKLVVTKELHDKIDELKELLSHSLQSGGTAELLELLVHQEMKRQEKKNGISLKASSKESREEKNDEVTAASVQTKIIRSRKWIPRTIQREVWRGAKGVCQYPGCLSRYRLEMDHIVPHAKGGSDSIENLRLYCQAHNLGHAMESYGTEFMNSYRRV